MAPQLRSKVCKLKRIWPKIKLGVQYSNFHAKMTRQIKLIACPFFHFIKQIYKGRQPSARNDVTVEINNSGKNISTSIFCFPYFRSSFRSIQKKWGGFFWIAGINSNFEWTELIFQHLEKLKVGINQNKKEILEGLYESFYAFCWTWKRLVRWKTVLESNTKQTSGSLYNCQLGQNLLHPYQQWNQVFFRLNQTKIQYR